MKAEVIKLYSIFAHVKYNLLYIFFTFLHVIFFFFSNIYILYFINSFLAFYYFYIIKIK